MAESNEDDDLLIALGVEVEPKKTSGHSSREERIIAGFEEISAFCDENGRTPRYAEGCDIFERIYAVRLDRLRQLPNCGELLSNFDRHGLLEVSEGFVSVDELDDDALLAELGDVTGKESDITNLKFVKSRDEIRAAEEIASRSNCVDFEEFKPLFKQVQLELDSGVRLARPFEGEASIKQNEFFVLGGVLAYVAETGDPIRAPNGESDARLRVIYSNGTESNLLRRSLQRALYKDDSGRRITDPAAGPLFGEKWEETDIESGTIYVLRSLSDHPFIAEHRKLVHKIGVTGGKVEDRIANAAVDSTYLLAGVEVVATYKLSQVNRVKLEALFHKLFAAAQLDLTISDRFGKPVRPREWFLVPLHVIDEAVKRFQDGTIKGIMYDPKSATLIGKP
jgi:hypothetical protein